MDWISGIQSALDYLEEHLTEEIDYTEAAKQAFSSVFHFQRIFRVLCGCSVGEYVRLRRLSLAAEALAHGHDKVIDVALRCGYDTPESFTRAFTRFHGITPSEARSGGPVKTFTRLSVKLILTGGNTLDYRIEKLDAFKILGKRKQVTKPQSAAATEDITAFWGECAADGTMPRIISYFPQSPKLQGLLGVCFSSELQGDHFPYGIFVEYDGRAISDPDLEVLEIPAHTYAVFTSRGKMPDAFADTYYKIVSEFFPQSTRYEYAEGVELEVYPSDKTDDPNYSCEIWIAVNEKA